MPVDWKALIDTADTIVDDTWGEPFTLRPWSTGTYTDGGPDETRAINASVPGVLRSSKAEMSARQQFISNQVQSAVVITMRQQYVDVSDLKKQDRIEAVDRNETYEVAYVDPDPTFRCDIHCVLIDE